MYFRYADNSTEFTCDWCGCNEFSQRGKLIVNLCCGCETLHIENNNKCNEVNREIILQQLESRKSTFKNIKIHDADYYLNKDNDVYSPYAKEQQIKKKVKLINPIKLKFQ